MPPENTVRKIPDFLNFIATKKKAGKDWAFLHIKVNSEDVSLEEINQFLKFQFQEDNPHILNFSDNGQVSLVVQDTNRKLARIDKKIYETFASDEISAVTHSFDEKGLEIFTKLVAQNIKEDDIPSQVSMKRLGRKTNSIMVLDDDAMVIRQLEHILSGFGHVVVLQNHKEFAETYAKYAPDILFLDIHLRDGTRGTDLIDNLVNGIDPNAHIIIISSDTASETVQEVKSKGVKGFAVKPFDRNKLFKLVMNAPTFIPRTAKI